jgi:MFS family permease
MWLVIILVGLAGQFAWAIENMYLNTYITYLNFTDPSGGFDYNTDIAVTTALSAVTATLTTIFMGSLTDKVGRRKLFVAIGYIVWGISTAAFGLFNVNSAKEIIPIAMSASIGGHHGHHPRLHHDLLRIHRQ